METVIFQPDKDKSVKIGDTIVTANGGHVMTGIDTYNKYLADNPAQGGASPKKTNVAVRDYVSGSGLSGITDWDGESVMVGGFRLTPEYVTNGVAYVDKDTMDSTIAAVKERNGIIGNKAVIDAVDDKYGARIEKALNDILNRKPFSYDPETAPAYAAYRSMYEREGEAAYRRVLNDNNTSVTGASGAVLAEAIAGRNDYLKKAADMIPELEKNAYSRYIGEGDRLTSALKSIADTADSYYKRIYTANRDSYNDLINAAKAEADEKQRWSDNARNARLDKAAAEQRAIENERNAINDSYQNAQRAADTAKKNIELEYYPQQLESEIRMNNARSEGYVIDNAISRGFFTRYDEAALPWLAAYRAGFGYSINPQLAAAAYEYDKQHAKKRGDIDAILGR